MLSVNGRISRNASRVDSMLLKKKSADKNHMRDERGEIT